jgi:hypothetical protein
VMFIPEIADSHDAPSTRKRTLTRREPIPGGSTAPSLARRVSLALPKSLS